MAEHVCKCWECEPGAFPEVSPRTPGFRSVRHHPVSMHPAWVKVDGEPVERVVSALSGEKGWAIHYVYKPNCPASIHRCACLHGACMDVKYGHVEFGPEDPTRKTLEEQVAEEGAKAT